MSENNIEQATPQMAADDASRAACGMPQKEAAPRCRKLRKLSLDEAKIVLTNGFEPEEIQDFRAERQYTGHLMAYQQPFRMKDGYILKSKLAMKVPYGSFWTDYGEAEELDAMLQAGGLAREQLVEHFPNPFQPRYFSEMDEFMFGKPRSDMTMSCFFGRQWGWGSDYFEAALGDDVRSVALLISCERDGPWMKSEEYQELRKARRYWQGELDEKTQTVHLLVVVALGWRAPGEDERYKENGCKLACRVFVKQIEEFEAKGEDPTTAKSAITLLKRAEMWTKMMGG